MELPGRLWASGEIDELSSLTGPKKPRQPPIPTRNILAMAAVTQQDSNPSLYHMWLIFLSPSDCYKSTSLNMSVYNMYIHKYRYRNISYMYHICILYLYIVCMHVCISCTSLTKGPHRLVALPNHHLECRPSKIISICPTLFCMYIRKYTVYAAYKQTHTCVCIVIYYLIYQYWYINISVNINI